MASPYDLITITANDLSQFERNATKSKIMLLLKLIFDELPEDLRQYLPVIHPRLQPIDGFEDQEVQGYEVVIRENKEIGTFVRKYIPFFILMKKK